MQVLDFVGFFLTIIGPNSFVCLMINIQKQFKKNHNTQKWTCYANMDNNPVRECHKCLFPPELNQFN